MKFKNDSRRFKECKEECGHFSLHSLIPDPTKNIFSQLVYSFNKSHL